MAEITTELYEALKKANREHSELVMIVLQHLRNPSESKAEAIMRILESQSALVGVNNLVYPHFQQFNPDIYADRRGQ